MHANCISFVGKPCQSLYFIVFEQHSVDVLQERVLDPVLLG